MINLFKQSLFVVLNQQNCLLYFVRDQQCLESRLLIRTSKIPPTGKPISIVCCRRVTGDSSITWQGDARVGSLGQCIRLPRACHLSLLVTVEIVRKPKPSLGVPCIFFAGIDGYSESCLLMISAIYKQSQSSETRLLQGYRFSCLSLVASSSSRSAFTSSIQQYLGRLTGLHGFPCYLQETESIQIRYVGIFVGRTCLRLCL